MTPETLKMIKDTLEMFVFLATELTILFLLISFLVGVLQEYIPPEKIKNILSSKHGKGYIIAALLGAITPFCSCSTIPFLKGLLRAKAGFGPMMVFLFSSPLLNPIVIVLFVVTFGMKVASLYFIMAMSVSITAGYFLEKFGFGRFIKPLVDNNSTCSTSAC
ncbi:MAG TPA: permease, partial [Leucothrix sp.]|nr:permease [Leucothrix sp.]